MSIGLITAAALMPAKPVPSPAPIPAKNVTIIVSNNFIVLVVPFQYSIQILFHSSDHFFHLSLHLFIHTRKQLLLKCFLQLSSFFDDRLRFLCTDQLCFSPVTFYRPSLQISFFYQPVNMYRYKIRLDFLGKFKSHPHRFSSFYALRNSSFLNCSFLN